MNLIEFYVVEFEDADNDQEAADYYGAVEGFYEGHYDTRSLSAAEMALRGLDASLTGWYEISDDDHRVMVVRVFESDDGWVVEEHK